MYNVIKFDVAVLSTRSNSKLYVYLYKDKFMYNIQDVVLNDGEIKLENSIITIKGVRNYFADSNTKYKYKIEDFKDGEVEIIEKRSWFGLGKIKKVYKFTKENSILKKQDKYSCIISNDWCIVDRTEAIL